MNWSDIGITQAAKIVEWFENDTFLTIIAPLLATEESDNINQLLENKDGETAGRIKAMREFVLWHDKALDIAKRETENK